MWKSNSDSFNKHGEGYVMLWVCLQKCDIISFKIFLNSGIKEENVFRIFKLLYQGGCYIKCSFMFYIYLVFL